MPPFSPHGFAARILIVDDNDFGLRARRGVLMELGHQVVTTMTPDEALDMCSQQSFDLIVTDYKMPGMNGVEFIQRVRQANKSVPVILLSGFAETLGLNSENTGADVVIQKSSNEVQVLISSVNRLLKRIPKKPAASAESGAQLVKRKKKAES